MLSVRGPLPLLGDQECPSREYLFVYLHRAAGLIDNWMRLFKAVPWCVMRGGALGYSEVRDTSSPFLAAPPPGPHRLSKYFRKVLLQVSSSFFLLLLFGCYMGEPEASQPGVQAGRPCQAPLSRFSISQSSARVLLPPHRKPLN